MQRRINQLQKKIRAEVIKEYLNAIGQNKCVCFTCGNASRYLREQGVEVVEVINPDRWWEFSEIQAYYKLFDATSGHLPIPLMVEIAKRLKTAIKRPRFKYVACGSGETYICLRLAFPFYHFIPVYNIDKPTTFNAKAPLNGLVEIL